MRPRKMEIYIFHVPILKIIQSRLRKIVQKIEKDFITTASQLTPTCLLKHVNL